MLLFIGFGDISDKHTVVEAHKVLPANMIIFNPGHCGGLNTCCPEHFPPAGGATTCRENLKEAKTNLHLIQTEVWPMEEGDYGTLAQDTNLQRHCREVRGVHLRQGFMQCYVTTTGLRS